MNVYISHSDLRNGVNERSEDRSCPAMTVPRVVTVEMKNNSNRVPNSIYDINVKLSLILIVRDV
jgi:hypothetical protein